VIHPSQWELIRYPPEGYEFVFSKTMWDKGIEKIMERPPVIHALYNCFLSKFIPVPIAKAYLQKYTKIPEADLIFSYNHLVFKKKPWIVNIEWLHMLTGANIKHLFQYRKVVEKAFSSNYCKGILTWNEVAKRSILMNLNCGRFQDKLEVVYPAVSKKGFVKKYNKEKVKLLFVGAGGPSDHMSFLHKGGLELIEAFILLDEIYNNLELVIRSPIFEHTKRRIRHYSNIRLIEQKIPWSMLEQEFKSADIFVHPTHYANSFSILDAMSYELPIITSDVYNNPEWVEDGVTGFIIKTSDKIPYYWKNLIPSGPTLMLRQFNDAIRKVDRRIVQELVKKISILVEDGGLRRRMGRAAKQEIEEGKFSIKQRNKKLKEIFDQAVI